MIEEGFFGSCVSNYLLIILKNTRGHIYLVSPCVFHSLFILETLDILEDLLHNVDPDNKAARQYYNVMSREWQAQKKKDKNAMKKMFGAFEKESGNLRLEKLATERRKLEALFGGTSIKNSNRNSTPSTSGVEAEQVSTSDPTSTASKVLSATASSLVDRFDENFLYVFCEDACELFGLPNGKNLTVGGKDALEKVQGGKDNKGKNNSKVAEVEDHSLETGGERGGGEETSREGEDGGIVAKVQPVAGKQGDWKAELANMTKTMSPLELAQVCQSVKSHDRKMWAHQLRDTCLYALMQHCLLQAEGAGKDILCLAKQAFL